MAEQHVFSSWEQNKHYGKSELTFNMKEKGAFWWSIAVSIRSLVTNFMRSFSYRRSQFNTLCLYYSNGFTIIIRSCWCSPICNGSVFTRLSVYFDIIWTVFKYWRLIICNNRYVYKLLYLNMKHTNIVLKYSFFDCYLIRYSLQRPIETRLSVIFLSCNLCNWQSLHPIQL